MVKSTEAKDNIPAVRLKEDAAKEEFIPVRRGKVDSVSIYEVKEDELKDLENGPPSSLYLNLTLSFASAFISFFIADVFSLNISEENIVVSVIFILLTICFAITMIILFCLWFKHRNDLRNIVKQIRERIS